MLEKIYHIHCVNRTVLGASLRWTCDGTPAIPIARLIKRFRGNSANRGKAGTCPGDSPEITWELNWHEKTFNSFPKRSGRSPGQARCRHLPAHPFHRDLIARSASPFPVACSHSTRALGESRRADPGG